MAEHEGARAVADLARANRRLSGALRIVLDTLDSQDVNTLFGRVIDEISETMDADGTVVYLAQPDGFHLRGLSDSLADAKVPQFMRLLADSLVISQKPTGGTVVRLVKLSHPYQTVE